MDQETQQAADRAPEKSSASATQPVPKQRESAADGRRKGAAKAANQVTEQHSVSFELPIVGRVWLGEPAHLPFYAGIFALAALEVVEWPVAAIVVVGKLLAENSHRETLRDFGEALESSG